MWHARLVCVLRLPTRTSRVLPRVQDPTARPSAAQLLCHDVLLCRLREGGLLPEGKVLELARQAYPTVADAVLGDRPAAATLLMQAGEDLAATCGLVSRRCDFQRMVPEAGER